MRPCVPVCLVAALFAACNSEDADVLIADYLDAADEFLRVRCACDYGEQWGGAGAGAKSYESPEACAEDLPPGAAERGCAEDLLASASKQSVATLACHADAFVAVTACLRAAGCGDTDGREACYQQYAAADARCAHGTQALQLQLVSCLYG